MWIGKNLQTLAGDCGGKPRDPVDEKPPNPVGIEEENRTDKLIDEKPPNPSGKLRRKTKCEIDEKTLETNDKQREKSTGGLMKNLLTVKR